MLLAEDNDMNERDCNRTVRASGAEAIACEDGKESVRGIPKIRDTGI